MMSPTIPMRGQAGPYTPTTDAMDRREYGVTKSRKPTSTGGGRAWSEEEELYLLQTRLQKMPYKHIAAHLKKTELACRLHYHQLSHGSNRRKRTTSLSSGSSNSGHSPPLHGSIPSPIREHDDSPSRSASPPGSAGSYGSISPTGIQLPSIMTATASASSSPRLPTILPKPSSMKLALASIGGPVSTGTSSPTAPRGYPTPLHDVHPHSAPLTAPLGYRGSMTPTNAAKPYPSYTSNSGPVPHGPGRLRLDCSALPPPPSSAGLSATPYSASHPVDMGKLNAIYNAHRASFWASIAAEYGPGANPVVLEQAWRGNSPITSTSSLSLGIAAHTPITPVGSPDDHFYNGQSKPDKTRISAILGIDANPRSPREREMVRRLEEERCSVGVVGA
ncbi:hypothetical protein QBC40DRAFT_22109 [Triangularia verruculosa]|uniref:Myb-like domain-containing protein n=1 Tax=Triangularia verruculosa TaxID=2587418 RepID=A0AAN6X9L7_9PEZI|nr:hypothetical protein QBC40DRAFT_22109 [Triangularia verruculosa]